MFASASFVTICSLASILSLLFIQFKLLYLFQQCILIKSIANTKNVIIWLYIKDLLSKDLYDFKFKDWGKNLGLNIHRRHFTWSSTFKEEDKNWNITTLRSLRKLVVFIKANHLKHVPHIELNIRLVWGIVIIRRQGTLSYQGGTCD